MKAEHKTQFDRWAEIIWKLFYKGWGSLSKDDKYQYTYLFYCLLKKRVHIFLTPRERRTIVDTAIGKNFIWMLERLKVLEKIKDKKKLMKKFYNQIDSWIKYNVVGRIQRDKQFTLMNFSWIIDFGHDPLPKGDDEERFERAEARFADISALDFEAYLSPEIHKMTRQEAEAYEEEQLKKSGRRSKHGPVTIYEFDAYTDVCWKKTTPPPKKKGKL